MVLILLVVSSSPALAQAAPGPAAERARVGLGEPRELGGLARWPDARRHIPLFAAFFLFILFSNWSGLLPFFGKVEFLRAPTSDVNVTLGLALVAFFYFQYQGFRALGVRGYLGKFFACQRLQGRSRRRRHRPVRRPDRVPPGVHQADHAGDATLRQHLRRRGRARRDHRR